MLEAPTFWFISICNYVSGSEHTGRKEGSYGFCWSQDSCSLSNPQTGHKNRQNSKVSFISLHQANESFPFGYEEVVTFYWWITFKLVLIVYCPKKPAAAFVVCSFPVSLNSPICSKKKNEKCMSNCKFAFYFFTYMCTLIWCNCSSQKYLIKYMKGKRRNNGST